MAWTNGQNNFIVFVFKRNIGGPNEPFVFSPNYILKVVPNQIMMQMVKRLPLAAIFLHHCANFIHGIALELNPFPSNF